MNGVRVAFDPNLPAFIATEQLVAGQMYKADDALPWREIGITELDLHAWWTAGLVYFKLPAPAETSAEQRARKKR